MEIRDSKGRWAKGCKITSTVKVKIVSVRATDAKTTFYDSATQASRVTGFKRSTISSAVYSDTHISNGCYWFREDSNEWIRMRNLIRNGYVYKRKNGIRQSYIGRRFGKLTVIKVQGDCNREIKYLCRCDCGREIIVSRDRLVKKSISSCGCIRHRNNKGLVRHIVDDVKKIGEIL